jgi:hypothetical protein
MRLCNFTVKIEIPDNFTTQKQDRALDAVDTLDLPRIIEAIVRDRLRQTNGLRYATAIVDN